MDDRTLLTPARAESLRRALLGLAILAGLLAGLFVLASQAAADFLREGPARALPAEGAGLRVVLGCGAVLAALAAGAALRRGTAPARAAAAAAALGAGFLLVHVLLTPAIALFALAAAAPAAGRVTRRRLAAAGPRRYPLRWAAGAVAAGAGLAALAAVSWYLASPLWDEGVRLDEELGFQLAIPAPAAATPAPAAATPAPAAATPAPAAATPAPAAATPAPAAATPAPAAATPTPAAATPTPAAATPAPAAATPAPAAATPTPAAATPTPAAATPTPAAATPTPAAATPAPAAATPTPAAATPTPTPAATPTPSAATPTPAVATPTPPPAATPTPGQGQLISMGELEGADEFHTGSGQVLLARAPDGSAILRFQDYAVRNGPDLYVYLTPDPDGDVHAAGAIEIGRVRATRGSVNYDVPRDADLGAFRAAVIYCKPFRVLFAKAVLR